MATNPTPADFEHEMRHYLRIETKVAEISEGLPVPPLVLLTQPLRYALKAEAAAWKVGCNKVIWTDL
mgnify:CR=1 FL=1